MAAYTRRQLALVLLLVAAAGVGLAVGQWRRAHPELAERLESFDHAPRPPRPRHAEGPPAARAQPGAAARAGGHDRPVHLNRAGPDELTRLPGVGAALASRIVAARPFASVDDLRRVHGLGEARVERLRPLVTVGD